ncbi:MAG: site-specific integrase [Gammaproteobacteria bacterium]
MQGTDPMMLRKARKAHTLGSFLNRNTALWVRVNRKRGEATVVALQAAFAVFQNEKLSDLTPWLIEKWRSSRLNSGQKRSSVNRYVAGLKAALSKAVEWGLIPENPMASVKPLKLDTNPIIRYLTLDEEGRLRAALDAREARIRRERASANQWRRERGFDPLLDLDNIAYVDYLKPLVLLLMNTGLRRGEAFNLTWDRVDFKLAQLTVTGTVAKSGQTRHVPLNSEALAVLRDWWAVTSEVGGALVFPNVNGEPLGTIKTAWKNLLRHAQIENFRLHDLRHHFASRLVMAGVDLNTVRELLGHADIQMTLRYAHLAPEHKAKAVALLDHRSGQIAPFKKEVSS